MAEPAITKGSDHFFVTTYEGNGEGQKVGKFVPFTDSGTIAKSCMINGATAQARLGRTPGSNGSGTILTFSAWVKRERLGSLSSIFIANDWATYGEALEFNTSNQINYYCIKSTGGVYDWNYITNRTFEDTSKWYHVYLRRDTTDTTAADRIQLYIDGERITSWNTETQSADNRTGWMNQTTYENSFGNTSNASYVRGIGYLAEVNMIDGSSPAVSTFGETDTSTGRWVPKTLTGITYGTNGFRMEFANTAGQTIGDDTSGNGNDLTVTNLAATDVFTDSPTQNHAVIGKHGFSSISEGRLKAEGSISNQWRSGVSSLGMKSGKYYWEVKIVTHTYDNFFMFGICNESQISYVTAAANRYPGLDSDNGSYGWQPNAAGNDDIRMNAGTVRRQETGTALANDDILQFAYDADNDKLYVGKNNTYIYSGDPANGTNHVMSGIGTSEIRYAVFSIHNDTSHKYEVNFGQKGFAYTPPSGFVALQQDNVVDEGVKPDLVWIKNRDSTDSHQLYDSSRGAQKDFNPDSNAAESTTTDGLQKFLKGGCEIEDDVSVNSVNESYVAWNWVVNGGTTSANTDGSGATLASTIQVNQTAGFSIVQYTGNATAGAKVAHGLSTKPDLIFLRRKDYSGSWYTYHSAEGATKYGFLEVSSAFGTASTVWNNTEPTSSVFTLSNQDTNTNTYNYIAYCWHSVEGFSRFGSYTGNGNVEGPFVYTGFKPSWLLIKNAPATASWFIIDNKRNLYNPVENWLVSDDPQAEVVTSGNRKIDFLSNGFKIRSNTTDYNGSGNKIIYMAFAEHPFIGSSSTSPATAR